LPSVLTANPLGAGLERGKHCAVDLSQVDHLEIAHLPLEQVRKTFSIVPLETQTS